MARTFSFIYDRFDENCSADMLEKSTSDWIRRGKPARKNMYYHYSAFARADPGFFEMGGEFCNNVREIKYYFNI